MPGDDDFGLDEYGYPRPMARMEKDLHLIALSRRVATLAEKIEQLTEADEKLTQMLDKRLPTEDELTSVRAVLADRAGREYIRKALKTWGIGGLSVLASIYLARGYLSQFFNWLGTALK